MVEGLLHLMDGVTRPGVDPTARPRRGAALDDRVPRGTRGTGAARARSSPICTGRATKRSSSAIACSHGCTTGRSCSSRPPAPGSTSAGRPRRANTTARAPSRSARPGLHRRARAAHCSAATPTTPTVDFLLERSGGNPFFVEELVAFMQESRDSDRLHELPATFTDSSRPGSTHSIRRNVRCSRTARSSARGGPSPRSSRSPTAPTHAAARRSRRTRLPRPRRRRFPLQVGADPRDRLRHAHQGRTRPPARPGCADARGDAANRDRPGRASSRDRRRARGRARARSTACPATSTPGNRRADCAPPTATSCRVVVLRPNAIMTAR